MYHVSVAATAEAGRQDALRPRQGQGPRQEEVRVRRGSNHRVLFLRLDVFLRRKALLQTRV